MNIVALFILIDHQHIIQSCFAVEHCGSFCKNHWKYSSSKQYYTYTVAIHSPSLDHILVLQNQLLLIHNNTTIQN